VIVRGLRVLRRVGDKLRLAPGAAEQHLFAVVHVAVWRVWLGRHAANGIALGRRGAMGGMIMGRMRGHLGHRRGLRSWLYLQIRLHLPTNGKVK
jgi:hypothetical protein